MKLFVSVLLFASVPAAFAQQNAGQVTVVPAQAATPQQQAALANAQTAAQAVMDKVNQTGCPLYMQSASVASSAGYLPVTASQAQNGVLDLHFRNQSGKAITSASVTARVSVKTNIYALDAHTVELRLSFGGTQTVDRDEPQQIQIGLPPHAYLFGVARVTLDQVTYADGTTWTAPASSNTCRTVAGSVDRIAK